MYQKQWRSCPANVVKVKLDSAPQIVSHYNLYRAVLIQGVENLANSSGRAIEDLRAAFSNIGFANIGFAWSGKQV
jgi:HAE1 family hydrophobic/amphiphilic exporter-1